MGQKAMLERLGRSRTHRELFLVLMTISHIDLDGTLLFAPGMDNHRYCTDDPHVAAKSMYSLFTREQAIAFENAMFERLSVAIRVRDVTTRWIEGRMRYITPVELLAAVCKEIYGIKWTPQWMLCMEPTNAVRAIMSCYTRKEQQNLRGKISARVYRTSYRSAEAVNS